MGPKFQLGRRSALISAVSAVLTSCGGGGAGEEVEPPALGQVINSTIKSVSNGNTYAIQVFLPESYAASTTVLPVIYATEGDAPYGGLNRSRFDTFKEVMQRRGTQAVLVGIGGTAWRSTDFLMPGATKYLDFLVKELLPSIESQYRIDRKRRALSGLSHGGYFVLAALILEARADVPPSFSYYLSTECSVGELSSPAAVLAFERQIDGKTVPATLFLAGASGGNHPLIGIPLFNQIATQNLPGLVTLKAEYNTSHVGADVPAFEDALERFFPRP